MSALNIDCRKKIYLKRAIFPYAYDLAYASNKLPGNLIPSQIELKLNHEQLVRTHAISGKSSAVKIKYLEKSMRTNGFDINTPIDVVAHNDKFYILDGQHRYRAAIMAGINEIPVKIITDIKNHPSSWTTIEEVVEAAAQRGHDHIKFKY